MLHNHQGKRYRLTMLVVLFILLLSMVPIQPALADGVGADNFIVNPGFEDGPTGWQQYSYGGRSLISTERPHTGSWSASLCGTNTPCVDEISQMIAVVPANASITLWWYMSTTNPTSNDLSDRLDLVIAAPSGDGRQPIADLSSPREVWSQKTIDLSPWVGQTIRLIFEGGGLSGGTTTTRFWIDDVSLSITPVVVNSGFEDGNTGWTQSSSNGVPVITRTLPHSGSYSVSLCGYGYDRCWGNVWQQIRVPSNGVLTYWWYISGDPEGGSYDSIGGDKLVVQLRDEYGGLITTLRTWSGTVPVNQWRQDTLSLADYAGRIVRLYFGATTDSWYPSTAFFVDDVSVR